MSLRLLVVSGIILLMLPLLRRPKDPARARERRILIFLCGALGATMLLIRIVKVLWHLEV